MGMTVEREQRLMHEDPGLKSELYLSLPLCALRQAISLLVPQFPHLSDKDNSDPQVTKLF